MDFTKFVCMLETASLYFARADQLGDPFEGASPKEMVDSRKFLSANLGHSHDPIGKVHQAYCQCVFISCWHANEYESAAMWKQYTRSNEAVAVQTKYGNLVRCLPDHPEFSVGQVSYVDYDTFTGYFGKIFNAFMHKRLSFLHENEIRAVVQDLDRLNIPQPDRTNLDLGRNVSVDLAALVECVYVAPQAATWFYELVSKVCERCGCKWSVKQSALDGAPVY